jgi:hypothetical protein
MTQMEDFVAMVLRMMDGDPARIGEVFGARLSHKDELMLTKIDEEMGACVEGILDLVLAGANYAGEITMVQRQRERVMELTAIRCAIHDLVRVRGSLQQWRDGLN